MGKIRLSTERSGGTWFGCLVDSEEKLVASAFGRDRRTVQAHLLEYCKKTDGDAVKRVHPLTQEMIELFNGKRVVKPTIFNTEHVSKFQRKVYRVLERIPVGKVTTYGLISKKIGSAPRAVGRAVASNPWPLFVPCQRVVKFDLTIGNYGLCGNLGPEGTVTKRSLLEREEVPMRDDRVNPKALWDPSRKNR